MTTATNQPGAAVDQELDPVERELLVRSAILAASMDNTQPWKFRFRHRTVEVHRDVARELLAEEPDDRLAMIGVGSAVFNLRVAAATLARSTTTVLAPDPDLPTLAAEVTLGRGQGDGTELAGLFLHLRRRRTNRQPFETRAVPHAARTDLEHAAAAEGTRLHWANCEQARMLPLAVDADNTEKLDLHRIVERGWLGGEHERDRDDTSPMSLCPWCAGLFSPGSDLTVELGNRQRGTAQVEDDPVLAILSTTKDSPRDWFAAGQALQRVLLVATHHHIAVSPVNQPVEGRDLRRLLHVLGGDGSNTQVVLRLGYGPTLPPAPRRPYEEFVLVEADLNPGPPGAECHADSSPSPGPPRT